jgi:hypothetical protein
VSAGFFDEVVEATGLASFIGPGIVERALQSVGVAATGAARSNDYVRAMPQIRARMAMYLKPAELEERVRAIETVLKKH